MMHDRIVARQFEKGFAPQDYAVFKIDMRYSDFAKLAMEHIDLTGGEWDKLTLPSRLPYNHLSFNLNDSVLWLSELPLDHQSNRLYLQHWQWQKDVGVFGSTSISMNQDLISLNTYDFSLDKPGTVPEARARFKDVKDPGMLTTGLVIFSILHRFLLVLSCTNVFPQYHEPPPKIQKKREKRNKYPLSSWYTLDLIPHINLSNIESKSSLEMNRAHFCRGHLAEYGVDGKGLLFGKLSGKFWISPHMRGSTKRGTIKKEYKLNI